MKEIYFIFQCIVMGSVLLFSIYASWSLSQEDFLESKKERKKRLKKEKRSSELAGQSN